jgi:hypothetical protein
MHPLSAQLAPRNPVNLLVRIKFVLKVPKL